MNAGCKSAEGEWIMFCHADTLPPPGYGSLISAAIESVGKDCCWGMFEGIQTEVKKCREACRQHWHPLSTFAVVLVALVSTSVYVTDCGAGLVSIGAAPP